MQPHGLHIPTSTLLLAHRHDGTGGPGQVCACGLVSISVHVQRSSLIRVCIFLHVHPIFLMCSYFIAAGSVMILQD